jgi:AraC-like DNA-binding protein
MEIFHIFMYITNIMAKKANHIIGKSLSIRIISSQYTTIKDWNLANLIAPFWRFYLPLNAGAIVIWNGIEYPFKPITPVMIPPYTDFAGKSLNEFEKMYCHFELQSNLHFEPGIYEFALPRNQTDRFKKIAASPSSENAEICLSIAMLESLAYGINTIMPENSCVNTLSQRTRKIISLMHENIIQPLTNQQLSNSIHMAENSMVRDFKLQTGSAPQKYYMRLRLEHACELLIKTSLSVEEISDLCGFWDRNHFTRYFSRQWSCPPAEFRKRNRGGI